MSAAVATTAAAASPPCTPGQPSSPTGECVGAPLGALPPARCDDPIAVFDGGERVGEVCGDTAKELGLTVIELGERWAPRVFDGNAESGPAPYRDRYISAAREEFGTDASWDRERRDRYFELFGIFPTFGVVAKRMNETERHACHAALDDTNLRALAEPVDTWRPRDKQRSDRLQARQLKEKLDGEAIKAKVAFDDLAKLPRVGQDYAAYKKLVVREQAIREMQNHLRCEKLLGDDAEAGILDEKTIDAMNAYMRRHMVVTWQLDAQLRDVLVTDSRDLDFRQALRALRERVVAATGLIEDGTALDRPGTVVGRTLDTQVFTTPVGDGPMKNGAEDLISKATDEAARALGWTDPERTVKALSDKPPERVAVRLSPMPDYHGPHMELSVQIDRGDIVYDHPYFRSPRGESARRERLPHLVVYARRGDEQIPLVRWPTTIGGWQPEAVGGSQRVMLMYKESPAGKRVWKDLVAEPRWIPPDTTPPRDLVRPRVGGGWAPKLDTFGPSYASAYGMVMLVHHWDTNDTMADQGIRTHGSVSYGSILEGHSHGCHRLHNHRAVRLGGFLLAHRTHKVHGAIPLDYVRSFGWRGKAMRLEFATRGFRYELDPPIEVEVLEGRVRGYAQRPLAPQFLPGHLARRYGSFE